MKKIICVSIAIGFAVVFAVCSIALYPKNENFGLDANFYQTEVAKDDNVVNGDANIESNLNNTDNLNNNRGSSNQTDNSQDNDEVDDSTTVASDCDKDNDKDKSKNTETDVNNDQSDEDSDTDTLTENKIENKYTFFVSKGQDKIFENGYIQKFYSGKVGENYYVYNLCVFANFDAAIVMSQNVQVQSTDTEGYNKTCCFCIEYGESFEISINGDMYTFECERYQNFSHQIVVARGQNAIVCDGTVLLANVGNIKLQIVVYANDNVYDCCLCFDQDVKINDGYVLFEILQTTTVRVTTSDGKYTFCINFQLL